MRYVIALAVFSSGFSACTKKKTPVPGAFDIGPIPAVSNVNTPTVTWTGADRATSYDLVISSTKDCQTSELSISSITGTEQTVTALADGTHYACVSAVNDGGSTSANNNGVEFVTDVTPPEAFSITGPTVIMGVKPALTWGESKGADAYDVKISKQSDCSSPVVTKADLSKTTLSLTPDDDLEDQGVYYACVTAKDLATNTTSATNDKFSFTAAHWRTISSPSNFVGREGHSAIWTGDGTGVTKGTMIVFGGIDASGNILSNGSIYDPSTDKWSALNSTGAPSARYGHTAVWTGSKMIVWGGCTASSQGSCSSYAATGASYDPATDTWSALPASGAPTARAWAASAWTGSSLLIWGGEGQGGVTVNDGKILDLQSSIWSVVSTISAPSDRSYAATAFGDGKFFVWGGVSQFSYNGSIAWSYRGDGAVYDVAADTWTATAATGVNTDDRYKAPAVWTGSSFVVWAGVYGLNFANTANGISYDPTGNQWSRLTPTGVTDKRAEHTAVWTGSQMLVWGGFSKPSGTIVYLATGGTLNPETGAWSDTTTTGAPTGRAGHSSVWTGDSMLVWGGYGSNAAYFNSGALYFP